MRKELRGLAVATANDGSKSRSRGLCMPKFIEQNKMRIQEGEKDEGQKRWEGSVGAVKRVSVSLCVCKRGLYIAS